jgi:hypothetical protein
LGENQQEDEGEKERLPRGEEDQSTLQIYVWRQHNETYQTLKKEGGGMRR